MATIFSLLPWIHIILAVALVSLILLQQNESSLGGTFGGGDAVGNFHKRRGLEKIIFNTTCIVAILFVGSILLSLIA
ncbi:MAG TPA: preprotein translocase subunit SecG [Candidatus Paceibacterota bacterium]|jgi:protein translocase SecG subunit|nr:preprotein translocase subunit SecG [Patescibacteria group bacterium]